ncbi:MAG: FAD-dependent monooxygenase [Hyphomicrobiales bacterium]|nr:FAD-dependent monooxygenase [Hyphomicrobiales bacterium]
MNEKNFDVAIFGNGLTAKVMCLVALHCGVNFINIRKKEKKENKPDDIRSLALSSASKNMLKILGVNPISQPVEKMIVFEGGVSNDKIKGNVIFDSKELHEQIAYICEYSVINKSLEDNLSLDSKNSIAEVPISIIDDGNYSKIVFKNKNIIKSKLNIFTEKLDKDLQKITSAEYDLSDYGQTAITTTLEHSKGNKGYAYQFFLKNGPLALLPLKKIKSKNLTSLVWTEKTSNASEILDAKGGLEESLNQMCGLYLGKIKVSVDPVSFPLKKAICKSQLIDRNILIGDAARSMHPLAGQAWNQALRDLAYLADAIVESRKLGLDIISCPSLLTFNRKRKIESNAFVEGISFINTVFRSDSSVAKGFRRNIMKLVNNKNILKKLIANEASGGVLERPSLLMNEAAGSKII